MEYQKTSVPSPDNTGVMVDALDIPITQSIEKWSEIHLDDGSIFRVKLNVVSVARLIGKLDENGKPLYFVNGQPGIAVVKIGGGDDKTGSV